MTEVPRAHGGLVEDAWQPIRGPFERWPHVTDFGLALLSFILSLLLWSRGSAQGLQGMESFTGVATFVCVFVGNFALLWRRSHPVRVHAVVLAASVLARFMALSDGIFAMTFSLYSLGRYTADDRTSLIGMLAALAFVATDLFILGTPGAGSVFAAVLLVTLWYAGRRLRFRGEYLRLLEERARHLERAKTSEAERAVAEERTRIARELHDVVAHQVSLMTVQAGAANTVAKSDPEAATEAMAAVEKAGRHALTEMRHLLSVLRPASDTTGLGPQPGVADLPRLVEEVREAGPAIELAIDNNVPKLPARVDLTVYRIVQEALTNVLKHAGPGASAGVTIGRKDDVLEVSVVDDGPGLGIDTARGHGIVGMRERAELLGGTLQAGPHPDKGFEVRATLPVGEQQA